MRTLLYLALGVGFAVVILGVGGLRHPAQTQTGYSCYTFDQWAFNTCVDGDGNRAWSI